MRVRSGALVPARLSRVRLLPVRLRLYSNRRGRTNRRTRTYTPTNRLEYTLMNVISRIRTRFTRVLDIAEHAQCTCLAKVGELHIEDCPLVSDANLQAVLDALDFTPREWPVIDFTRSIPGRAPLISRLDLEDLL